jgi:hypothetical protein
MTANDVAFDAFFTGRINQSTILVDLLSTGRLLFEFAERTGASGMNFVMLLFLEGLLNPEEKRGAERRHKAGMFQHLASIGRDAPRFPLECLLQSHYPPVAAVALDPSSGGVAKSFGTPELNQEEQEIIVWKSGVVTEFIRAWRRRGLALPSGQALSPLIEKALNAIGSVPNVMRSFPTFLARDRFNPFWRS